MLKVWYGRCDSWQATVFTYVSWWVKEAPFEKSKVVEIEQQSILLKYRPCSARMLYRFGSKSGISLTDKLTECIYLIPWEGWWVFLTSFPHSLPSADHPRCSRAFYESVCAACRHGKDTTGTAGPRRRATPPQRQPGSRDSQRPRGKENKNKTNLPRHCLSFKKKEKPVLYVLLATCIVDVFLSLYFFEWICLFFRTPYSNHLKKAAGKKGQFKSEI